MQVKEMLQTSAALRQQTNRSLQDLEGLHEGLCSLLQPMLPSNPSTPKRARLAPAAPAMQPPQQVLGCPMPLCAAVNVPGWLTADSCLPDLGLHPNEPSVWGH